MPPSVPECTPAVHGDTIMSQSTAALRFARNTGSAWVCSSTPATALNATTLSSNRPLAVSAQATSSHRITRLAVVENKDAHVTATHNFVVAERRVGVLLDPDAGQAVAGDHVVLKHALRSSEAWLVCAVYKRQPRAQTKWLRARSRRTGSAGPRAPCPGPQRGSRSACARCSGRGSRRTWAGTGRYS